MCHHGAMRFCFQPKDPDTDTASRNSLCFSGWKDSVKANSLERMTDGKTQASNLQEMCYDRAGIGLLRSLHGSHPVMVQWMLKNKMVGLILEIPAAVIYCWKESATPMCPATQQIDEEPDPSL